MFKEKYVLKKINNKHKGVEATTTQIPMTTSVLPSVCITLFSTLPCLIQTIVIVASKMRTVTESTITIKSRVLFPASAAPIECESLAESACMSESIVLSVSSLVDSVSKTD